MAVAVEDEVRPVLGDRLRSGGRCRVTSTSSRARPRSSPSSARSGGGRCGPEQSQTLAQAAVESGNLSARLGVDAAEERFPRVGQQRARGEAADEALRPDDPHVDAAHRDDPHACSRTWMPPPRSADTSLLGAGPRANRGFPAPRRPGRRSRARRGRARQPPGLAVGRQVACEQDQVAPALGVHESRSRAAPAPPRSKWDVAARCSLLLVMLPPPPLTPLDELVNRAGRTTLRRHQGERRSASREHSARPSAVPARRRALQRGPTEGREPPTSPPMARPAHAERALQVLADLGMRSEKPPEGGLTGVGRRSARGHHLPCRRPRRRRRAFRARGKTLEVNAVPMKVMSLEDTPC